MTRLPDDGWKEALAEYMAAADDLHAGRTPRPAAAELTLAALGNHFLTAKKHKLNAGEIAPVTFTEYRSTTDRLVAAPGKGWRVGNLATDDFARYRADLALQYGPRPAGGGGGQLRVRRGRGADQGPGGGRPGAAAGRPRGPATAGRQPEDRMSLKAGLARLEAAAKTTDAGGGFVGSHRFWISLHDPAATAALTEAELSKL